MNKKMAWILTGDGINCEEETAEACRQSGFSTEIIHLSTLIKSPRNLDECSMLVIPGGFSFGDELGSGRVLALKLKYQIGWDLPAFARAGGLVLGICNGFQVLVALGVFGAGVALAHNETGRFINKWVTLKRDPTSKFTSLFLDDISEIELPIRHGEGRLLLEDPSLFGKEFKVALTYEENPNGSFMSIAGVTDSTGRILGLMPHPEAFIRPSQHPAYFQENAQSPSSPKHGDGFRFFKNAFQGAREI